MLQDRRGLTLIFAVLIIGCVVLRLVNLDRGISGDEGALLFYATGDITDIIAKLKAVSIFPPLSAIPLHAWTLLFGNIEIWVRLYFVIFGVGACYLVYLIGREYLDKKFALISLFISAVSPFLIWTSQYIRSYIDATFWALLSTYFLLKLLKGKLVMSNYIFYALSSAAAIYVSYFNILILLSQSVFMLIFFYKDWGKLSKWLLSALVTASLFLPWFFTALAQYQNATGIKEFWNLKGFRFGGIYVGRIMRQIAALFGMDPDFLNSGLTQSGINIWLLYLVSFAVLVFVLWFIYSAVKSLYRVQYGNHRLVWFFILLAILPIVLANLAEALYNFRPTPKLFSYSCAIFIFLMAVIIYPSYNDRKSFHPVLAAIVLAYLLRLPFAYQPEMDTKRAYDFLAHNLRSGEVILMVRNANYYLSRSPLPNLALKEDLKQDLQTGDYVSFLDSADEKLERLRGSYENIWFYRSYGTDELLGANKLILAWLEQNGYRLRRAERFKRIDLLNFTKKR